MTYTKTTWASGSTIWATSLNNLETQYDTVTTDWGPYKFGTSPTTTDTMVYEDTSTWTAFSVTGQTNPMSLSTNDYGIIHIPTNIQKSELKVEITGRCCSSGSGLVHLFLIERPYIYASTMTFYSPVQYTFNTTSFVTKSSINMTVYPGESLYLCYVTNSAFLGVLKNLRFWGRSTTPSTGFVIST